MKRILFLLLLLPSVLFAERTPNPNQMTMQQILNRQNQPYTKTLLWDVVLDSAASETTAAFSINEWTGTTGYYRAEIQLEKVGADTPGFWYEFQTKLDRDSSEWTSPLDGSGIVISEANAIDSALSWHQSLPVLGGDSIRFILHSGDSCCVNKFILWVR